MSLTRLRQLSLLVRPTARVVGWGPLIWAAIPAIYYVGSEAPGGYVDYRVQVLRLGALLLCMGSTFILDDPTEDTLGYVPMPLVLRRGLRVAVALPAIALVWALLLVVAGRVAPRDGGPLPISDLTLEVMTLLVISLVAACVGARLKSDQLGGIVGAPIVLAAVSIAMFLPPDRRLILSSISDPKWDQVHDQWMLGLIAAAVLFAFVNRSPGRFRPFARFGKGHAQLGKGTHRL